MMLDDVLNHFQDESSIESDEFDMSDSTRMSAVNSDLSSNLEERMQSPQALHGQQDGKPFRLNTHTQAKTNHPESEFIRTATSYSSILYLSLGDFFCVLRLHYPLHYFCIQVVCSKLRGSGGGDRLIYKRMLIVKI